MLGADTPGARWNRRERPTAPEPTNALIDLGPAKEVLPGSRAVATVFGCEFLLIRTRSRIFAVRNRCPHLGAPLSDGRITSRTIACAVHGYKYDLESGRCSDAPSRRSLGSGHLAVIPLQVIDGHVFLDRDAISDSIVDGRERTTVPPPPSGFCPFPANDPHPGSAGGAA